MSILNLLENIHHEVLHENLLLQVDQNEDEHQQLNDEFTY